ncbi:MAG: tetratricopeptide repeat protein [Bacteroidetes bacterium]|nr:tetratricopeptide repeat protein [Bacteroidota bacterium]MBU1115406.1 tetratricopeptide repeat protein [Bacteroidota bacterium]MBU1797927.1 tetratricopeptide repeat protein [Bacteroidota bacterium]
MNNLSKSILFIFLLASTFLIGQEMNNDAALLYNDGNKLIKSGQYNGAIEKYNAAILIQKHPNIYYQKSIAEKKLRKFEDAEKSLLQCIEIDPNFMAAYSGLGTTYYSLKNYQAAIDNFNKYLEKTDDKKGKSKIQKFIGLSYTQLGQEAKRDGKHQQAISYLNEGVKNYKYDSAYLTLAEIYIELAQYENALEAADNAINNRKDISPGAGYYYKGLAFKGLGNNEKAKESFGTSVKDKTYKANSEYELKQMNK